MIAPVPRLRDKAAGKRLQSALAPGNHSVLILRADADRRNGTGHVMRCLALGQAWSDQGGEVIFVTATRITGLLARLRSEDFVVHQLTQRYPAPGDWVVTRRILGFYPGAWVVVDGYHFDETYQYWVKEAGHRLLAVDDMAFLSHYYADVVLNQNLHAEELTYDCEPYARLLLGTRYVLLRREFVKWRQWRRQTPEVACKLLVTFGGVDTENLTSRAIAALGMLQTDSLDVRVIVGGGVNSSYAEVEAVARQVPFQVRVLTNVEDMASLMAWADVALSAGGSTVWEMAFMGLPLVGVSQGPQEELLLRWSTRVGFSVYLGKAQEVGEGQIAQALAELLPNENQRRAMSAAGQGLVDGYGTTRVIAAIKE